jgi:hypothetical protein
MVDLERTLSFAKAGKYSRSELYSNLMALAEQRREPGQSSAQAFSRFISTPEGRELYQLQKSLPGRDIEPDSVVTKSDTGASEWSDLVRAMRKAYGYTEHQAINACLSTEAGRFCFSKVKRQQQIAADVGFTKADMTMLDQIAADHDSELAKREPKGLPSDYEVECNRVRQQYPNMKESDVHDHVRARNPEAWEEHKKLSKLGGRKLPQPQHQVEQAGDEDIEAPTSGRRQPKRPAQWRFDHAHSELPPEPEPEHPSERPAVKIIVDASRHSGLSPERVVEIFKSLPIGRRLLGLAAREVR